MKKYLNIFYVFLLNMIFKRFLLFTLVIAILFLFSLPIITLTTLFVHKHYVRNNLITNNQTMCIELDCNSSLIEWQDDKQEVFIHYKCTNHHAFNTQCNKVLYDVVSIQYKKNNILHLCLYDDSNEIKILNNLDSSFLFLFKYLFYFLNHLMSSIIVTDFNLYIQSFYTISKYITTHCFYNFKSISCIIHPPSI